MFFVYGLNRFIKTILLSDNYRVRNKTHKDDESPAKLRPLRYLSGFQMAESFFHDLDKSTLSEREGNTRFSSRTWVEFKKIQLMEVMYPDGFSLNDSN